MDMEPKSTEQAPAHSLEDAILWADGTWCYREELEQMTHMSDDYQVFFVGTPEWEQVTNDEPLASPAF